MAISDIFNKRKEEKVADLESSFAFNFSLDGVPPISEEKSKANSTKKKKKKKKKKKTEIENGDDNVCDSIPKNDPGKPIEAKEIELKALPEKSGSVECLETTTTELNVETKKKKKQRKKKKKSQNKEESNAAASSLSSSQEQKPDSTRSSEEACGSSGKTRLSDQLEGESLPVNMSNADILNFLKRKTQSNGKKNNRRKQAKDDAQGKCLDEQRLGTTNYLKIRKATGKESETQRMELRYGKGRRNLAATRVRASENDGGSVPSVKAEDPSDTFSFNFDI